MKALYILFISLLISSCYYNTDLNNYNNYNNFSNNSRADEYYWYYDPQLFYNVDSCQVVGFLTNNTDEMQINHQYIVYNDTIYVTKRYIAKDYNIFNGVIYIKDKKPFRITTRLQ